MWGDGGRIVAGTGKSPLSWSGSGAVRPVMRRLGIVSADICIHVSAALPCSLEVLTSLLVLGSEKVIGN